MSQIESAGTGAALTPEIAARVQELLDEAGIHSNRDFVRRIVTTGILLGLDDTERLDLKISSAALDEMREAFQLFAPFAASPKVTVFGSARTRTNDPLYVRARSVAEALAGDGWMVVTGAGPGIMQAAVEGAGAAQSIGVSIRLPFEEAPDAMLADPNVVTMKYFFTRKLMLVKESKGFVCLPGGFGTLDEIFELLTLQQTGKSEPVPIVLLDQPGGTFWEGLRHFIEQTLVPAGVISPSDFERVLVTDSVDAAVAEVTRFWHNYNSLRWIGDRLVLRLNFAPSDDEIAELNQRFSALVAEGEIARTGPLAPELRDNDLVELPRIVLTLVPRQVGELHHLISALNELGSARH